MIYLAGPYTHPDAAVRAQRFQAVCRVAARLLLRGEPVFSPVVHGHPLVACGLPTDWSFWSPFCRKYLEACQQVVVLMLDGWEESVGVLAEIEIADSLGKPIWYRAADGLSLPKLAHVANGRKS